MRKLYYSAAVLAALALCAGHGFAQSSDGYKGVMAPSHTTPPDTTNDQHQPPGYRGLIPGYVAPQHTMPAPQNTDPATQPVAAAPALPMTPVAKPPQMTYRPGYNPSKPMTADDLKWVAAMTGVDIRLNILPPEMAKTIQIPASTYSLISSPATRIDGMLPTEFTTKSMIDETMQRVRDTSLTPVMRKQVIDTELANLTNFARTMRIRNSTPDELFEDMGVPAIFVKEDREGTAKAAQRLQEAINTLKQMDQ